MRADTRLGVSSNKENYMTKDAEDNVRTGSNYILLVGIALLIVFGLIGR